MFILKKSERLCFIMFKKVSGFVVILSLAFSFVFLPSEAFAAQKTVNAFKNVYVTDICSSTYNGL